MIGSTGGTLPSNPPSLPPGAVTSVRSLPACPPTQPPRLKSPTHRQPNTPISSTQAPGPPIPHLSPRNVSSVLGKHRLHRPSLPPGAQTSVRSLRACLPAFPPTHSSTQAPSMPFVTSHSGACAPGLAHAGPRPPDFLPRVWANQATPLDQALQLKQPNLRTHS
ncbi:hypothetical protein D5F01_LYC02242 [Larimichthys crocea]|uniref:Uncharacterized protein n=1 Tax=Larimichthys crocea TaxID=215358 RepID=A0A6G0J8A2_LARCR|nr:hypothetical protein D5F01_LYC02242 [Larimichthys crocea]